MGGLTKRRDALRKSPSGFRLRMKYGTRVTRPSNDYGHGEIQNGLADGGI